MKIKTVNILIGPSCSGKTEWIKKQGFGGTIISADEIKRELFSEAGIYFNEIFSELLKRFKKVLQKNNVDSTLIYLDYPFLTRASRELIYKICKESPASCDIWAVVFKTPIEICLERNSLRQFPLPEKIIRRQFEKLQLPFELDPSRVEYITNSNLEQKLVEAYQMCASYCEHEGGDDQDAILSSGGSSTEPNDSSDSSNSNSNAHSRDIQLDNVEVPSITDPRILELCTRYKEELEKRCLGPIGRWIVNEILYGGSNENDKKHS